MPQTFIYNFDGKIKLETNQKFVFVDELDREGLSDAEILELVKNRQFILQNNQTDYADLYPFSFCLLERRESLSA